RTTFGSEAIGKSAN
ncbi:silent information regulator protein Sir2, partial [Enterococcus faecalis]